MRSLLTVGAKLPAISDLREMMDVILREARLIARAEAGSLFGVKEGRLRFVAAQNDRLALPEVVRELQDKEMAVSDDSLAGFAASSGRVINIPDAYALTPGAPFRINRDFDSATGYRTKSVLTVPLKCPDGNRIGVLQLINRISPSGAIVPFSTENSGGLMALSSMAAVTIQNALLKEQLHKAHLDTIIRLSVAAEFRDDDTASHIRRISAVSTKIAQALGMPPEQVELIQYASPMHDVGKIGVPDAILCKPGKLTPEERKIVQTHATIGAKILGEPTNDLIAMARDVAVSHHERWDGGGYPDGLSGCDIPFAGRIVGLADVFDALVSERCYKPAYSVESALGIIRSEGGKHFDPNVTEAFFNSLDEILLPYERGEVVEEIEEA